MGHGHGEPGGLGNQEHEDPGGKQAEGQDHGGSHGGAGDHGYISAKQNIIKF
jgi:hypothetical protein